MKVVIIGGGIAGLTLGIFLQRKNIEAVVFERSGDVGNRGHGFLMHTDGLDILSELILGDEAKIPGKAITEFSLRRPSGIEIKYQELDSWCCIKRVDLIHFLYSLIFPENIRHGKAFSHFTYENGKAVAAVFSNGEVEYGDIFVGADGKNSKVRDLLFGKVNFSTVRVKEVVGICKVNPVKTGTFIKYQSSETGLAFGLIPVSETEKVWFLQYDADKGDVYDSTPEELEAFCNGLLIDFPEDVKELMRENDFNTSYIWNTCDFDLLPAFHSGNVVLIGDAAHVALPFTSAGTTNAILDARTLATNLAESGNNYEKAFADYYSSRLEDLVEHLTLGRELKNSFLYPSAHTTHNIPVPLFTIKQSKNVVQKGEKIKIQYFTDPICSTCWVLQPLLRKLELEYGKIVDVHYHMGGMLQSWEHYQKGKIKDPNDAAVHWEEVAVQHNMPLDGDVWVEDPLNSSYPPSIAFKAAQMQRPHKAKAFLRRIQEMVFAEKKNITKWEHLESAAIDTGLDSEQLLKDFALNAKELFVEDMLLKEQLGITTFPTLYLTNNAGAKVVLKGYQLYEKVEEAILKLNPDAQKQAYNKDAKNLFSFFPTLTTKEFSFLSDTLIEETLVILNALLEDGQVDKYESKNGDLWKYKQMANAS
jgi:2-polyprenyl-6-methoxyphenol hydroxylase-like FAD-dependent oxidoreductase/predicted DsbA family dithiol-disulfide isomerase